MASTEMTSNSPRPVGREPKLVETIGIRQMADDDAVHDVDRGGLGLGWVPRHSGMPGARTAPVCPACPRCRRCLGPRVVRSNRARVVTGIDEPGCEVAWSIEERIAAQVCVVGGKRGLQMADGKIRAGNGVAHVREHGSVVESKVLGAIRKGAPSHRPMGQHITGEHQPWPDVVQDAAEPKPAPPKHLAWWTSLPADVRSSSQRGRCRSSRSAPGSRPERLASIPSLVAAGVARSSPGPLQAPIKTDVTTPRSAKLMPTRRRIGSMAVRAAAAVRPPRLTLSPLASAAGPKSSGCTSSRNCLNSSRSSSGSTSAGGSGGSSMICPASSSTDSLAKMGVSARTASATASLGRAEIVWVAEPIVTLHLGEEGAIAQIGDRDLDEGRTENVQHGRHQVVGQRPCTRICSMPR